MNKDARYKQLVRQNEGGVAWEANNFKGTINWCTAVGKSFFSVYKHPTEELHGFIQRFHLKHPDKDILIILHDKINLSQWYKNLLNFFPDLVDYKIKLFTMDGIMSKVELVPLDLNGGLLVIDEIHKLTTTIKRRLWDGTHIIYDHCLFLTGTVELIEKNAPSLYRIAPVVDKIGLEEARELGFINKSEYTVILQDLDDESMVIYKEYSKYIWQAINKDDGRLYPLYKFIPIIHNHWKNPDFNFSQWSDLRKMLCIMNILMPKGKGSKGGAYCKTKKNPNGEFITHDRWIEVLTKAHGWSEDLDPRDPFNPPGPEDMQTYAINLHRAWHTRPKLVQNHTLKVEATYKLLELFDFKRSIVFGESTQFVDDLHALINERQGKEYAVKYHSKVKIQATDKDGNPKVMKRRKDLAKYARGMENPIYKVDKQGKYLEVPSCIGKDKVMPHNKAVLDALPNNKGVYIFAKAGDTGFNDPLIQLGIIASYSKSTTVSSQRGGRVIRLDPDSLGDSKQVIYLAFNDTYEIGKVTKLVENLSRDNIYTDWTTLEGYLNQDGNVDLTTVKADDFVIPEGGFDLTRIGL